MVDHSQLKRLQSEVEALQKYPSGEVTGTLMRMEAEVGRPPGAMEPVGAPAGRAARQARAGAHGTKLGEAHA
ncbi:hypothetical protein CYMTET_40577 [Cymbomonas tetramitiformis]|uniref:Uncharacterized protein n=1 Tax=Cymbomonas tetramitiformis TaxID=36881 RepID=A0AAE0C9K7_9CHLO|nr:hypothetical protein CYMTET_40577 [Cymbomonas tetramitiformis]